jgi:hypothetical protein
MALARFAQGKVFDTTNTSGSESPIDASECYVTLEIPIDETAGEFNTTNFNQKSQLNSTELGAAQRDEFDLSRAYGEVLKDTTT